MYYGTNYDSPLGNIIIASDESHIVGVWFENQKHIDKTMPADIIYGNNLPIFQRGIKWLNDYFSNKKPSIADIPLAPIGGEFRQIVWKILMEIPYGETMTYGDVAKETAKRMDKKSMSAQAVGGAIGHNPIAIIVPCHRVVGADRNLTGYAGGIEKKIMLLSHEGVDIGNYHIPHKLI